MSLNVRLKALHVWEVDDVADLFSSRTQFNYQINIIGGEMGQVAFNNCSSCDDHIP